MFPSNLQCLEIDHSPQHLGGSNDLFLSQAYPNLAGQLDLWTNLPFDFEEPLVPTHEEHKNAAKLITEEEEEGEEVRSPISGEKAIHEGHVNVVTPVNDPVNPNSNHSLASQSSSEFDIDSFLSSLGVDAFAVQGQLLTITPSLAQLRVLHPPSIPGFGAALPQCTADATATAPLSFTGPTSILSEHPHAPTARRALPHRVSVTSIKSPNSPEETLPPNPNLSPAEDKRRRNTTASARFRLRKKEWESALEGREKELEIKVKELERECADLRRQNEWLKGLVIGVTGPAQGPTNTCLSTSSPLPEQLD